MFRGPNLVEKRCIDKSHKVTRLDLMQLPTDGHSKQMALIIKVDLEQILTKLSISSLSQADIQLAPHFHQVILLKSSLKTGLKTN